MSSSIEEQFQPPEWATKDEVIKAAQHYINYWKIESKSTMGMYLHLINENRKLREEIRTLKIKLNEQT